MKKKKINKCLLYVEELLKTYGWKTLLLKNDENNKNNLIAVLNGELSNLDDGLLLAGHIDTVSTNLEKWDTDPTTISISNGQIFGLGTADMKSFSAAILGNLDQISKMKLKKPLIFCLTNDEETVMYSINKVSSYLKTNNLLPKYAIIGEPSNMIFSNSNKGFYEFETIIHGKASHSSKPQLGVNAIYIMSKLISYIETLANNYSKLGTTMNVGIINGGRMCNVVADYCSIRFDVRTFLREHVNDIKTKVDNYLKQLCQEYAGSTFTNDIVFKIPVFEDKEVEITKNLMKKYNIKETFYDAATEAGFYQEIGINSIIFGCGDIKDAHAINEKISYNDYVTYQKLLLSFINDICC